MPSGFSVRSRPPSIAGARGGIFGNPFGFDSGGAEGGFTKDQGK
jgi:hypothetical protein